MLAVFPFEWAHHSFSLLFFFLLLWLANETSYQSIIFLISFQRVHTRPTGQRTNSILVQAGIRVSGFKSKFSHYYAQVIGVRATIILHNTNKCVAPKKVSSWIMDIHIQWESFSALPSFFWWSTIGVCECEDTTHTSQSNWKPDLYYFVRGRPLICTVYIVLNSRWRLRVWIRFYWFPVIREIRFSDQNSRFKHPCFIDILQIWVLWVVAERIIILIV